VVFIRRNNGKVPVLWHRHFIDLVPQMATDTRYGTKIRPAWCAAA
jgi:hypothetical protein